MSTISIYKKYRLRKKELHSLMLNSFHFPAEHMDCMSRYYLKHWQGIHLARMISEGTILDSDVEYMVVYQGCTPYRAKRAHEIKLSFRCPVSDIDLPAYVLVRVVSDEDGSRIV